ncbi:PREDICTED: glycosyltransferase 6 domain-containing protein 1 [Condylura cristata]|uniref:glycosyltransferase 6 domain-containing protein 1 n=1 Tax=Condylura cristata TaxID=143302 RepID=UPI000643E66A|nr:PREDICTED: glycosyltransferase 6 domain-containing protein 1 [Condylura cristata]
MPRTEAIPQMGGLYTPVPETGSRGCWAAQTTLSTERTALRVPCSLGTRPGVETVLSLSSLGGQLWGFEAPGQSRALAGLPEAGSVAASGAGPRAGRLCRPFSAGPARGSSVSCLRLTPLLLKASPGACGLPFPFSGPGAGAEGGGGLCPARLAGVLSADRSRPDVVTLTPWGAPVVWEGTFDRDVLRRHYSARNLTVGLAVFAAGRTADRDLAPFLTAASKHFMVGSRVVFYVMADAPHVALPRSERGEPRRLQVLEVPEGGWGQSAEARRMWSLAAHIRSHIAGEVDFLFSMLADQVFQRAVGEEALGASVAQLHPWWYFRRAGDFPYERRPASAACVPPGQGDFYYDGALVGGTPRGLLGLAEQCLRGLARDARLGLRSTCESHLNKYFLRHKPSKLLSPEYNWDASLWPPPQVRAVKVAQRSRRRP